MFFVKSLILFLFVTFYGVYCDSTPLTNCYYNNTTKQIDLVCNGETAEHFRQSTFEYLYCANTSEKIDLKNVQEISIKDCKMEEFTFGYSGNFEVFNISSVGLKNFIPSPISWSTQYSVNHLKKMIATHNELTTLTGSVFSVMQQLTTLDLSYNRIFEISAYLFRYSNPMMQNVNFSHNLIEHLPNDLFKSGTFLEIVDLSYNKLKKLDSSLFKYNMGLKRLHLENNPMTDLDCAFLQSLTESRWLNITINTLEIVDRSCINGKTTHGNNIQFDVKISTNESISMLRIADGNFEWIFNQDDFKKIRHLNLSDNQHLNTSMILQVAGEQLETLDLSNTFVGELNEETFQRFVNLKVLNLCHTNLTNFQLRALNRQTYLEILDISYNDLSQIGSISSLFMHLKSLKLQGNNLKEIDGVIQAHFPQLNVIDITKNQFTCEYLLDFFLKWRDLPLIDHPWDQRQLDAIDCSRKYHMAISGKTDQNVTVNSNCNNSNNSSNLFIVIVLLCLILIIITVNKFKLPLRLLKERLIKRSTEWNIHLNSNENNEPETEIILT